MEMTPAKLREICEKNDLYRTPELNDKLYLHYKGFSEIKNLEAYTGLKCLYLEGNGLRKIGGLDKQTKMRSLFLQENCIETIEGLSAMTELDSVNLSQNFIEKVENLGPLRKLQTLNLSQNRIKDVDSLNGLLECPSILCLDLQNNKIEDPAVLDLLGKLPNLRVLYVKGNPFVKKVRFYRKNVIYRFPELKYLDDRPVFDDDRSRAVAWCEGFKKGGVKAAREAEKAEIARLRKAKEDKARRNMEAFDEMIRKAREQKQSESKDDDMCPSRVLEKATASAMPPTPPSAEGAANADKKTRLLRSRSGELFEIDASNRFTRLRGNALKHAETHRAKEIVEWDKVAPSQQAQLDNWPEDDGDLRVSPFSGEPILRAGDVKRSSKKIHIPGFAHWDGDADASEEAKSSTSIASKDKEPTTAPAPSSKTALEAAGVLKSALPPIPPSGPVRKSVVETASSSSATKTSTMPQTDLDALD
eukprot:g983.t1